MPVSSSGSGGVGSGTSNSSGVTSGRSSSRSGRGNSTKPKGDTTSCSPGPYNNSPCSKIKRTSNIRGNRNGR